MDQRLGLGLERFGAGDQIGFVVGEEIEHRAQHARIAEAGAQFVRRQPGQIEQAFRAARIPERPAERSKGERAGAVLGRRAIRRTGSGGRRIAKNCQSPGKSLGAAADRSSAVAKRIMVVEDNDLNRKLFCDVLKVNGHEVVPVADGQNVLSTAAKFQPDLVIMDIQLPNVSGVELIAGLKADARLAATPILAVTAYAGKGDEERIRDAGASDYLSKPVSIGPFMAAVRTLLGE